MMFISLKQAFYCKKLNIDSMRDLKDCIKSDSNFLSI